jgi:hypothetical protein
VSYTQGTASVSTARDAGASKPCVPTRSVETRIPDFAVLLRAHGGQARPVPCPPFFRLAIPLTTDACLTGLFAPFILTFEEGKGLGNCTSRPVESHSSAVWRAKDRPDRAFAAKYSSPQGPCMESCWRRLCRLGGSATHKNGVSAGRDTPSSQSRRAGCRRPALSCCSCDSLCEPLGKRHSAACRRRTVEQTAELPVSLIPLLSFESSPCAA